MFQVRLDYTDYFVHEFNHRYYTFYWLIYYHGIRLFAAFDSTARCFGVEKGSGRWIKLTAAKKISHGEAPLRISLDVEFKCWKVIIKTVTSE